MTKDDWSKNLSEINGTEDTSCTQIENGTEKNSADEKFYLKKNIGSERDFNQPESENQEGYAQDPGEPESNPQHLSFLDIVYGIIAQPRDTFQYLGRVRPVLAATGFVVILTMFNFLLGLSDLNSINAGFNLQANFSAYLIPMFIIGFLFAIIAWFLNTAAVSLAAQLLGGVGNGPGLLAAFSFALLPMLITAIADFGVKLLGLGSLVAGLINLAGFIWLVTLQIIAVSEIEELSTSRSIVVYFCVPLSIMVSIGVTLGLLVAIMAPWLNQLPSVPFR